MDQPRFTMMQNRTNNCVIWMKFTISIVFMEFNEGMVGLSLPIRPAYMGPLKIFHNKILRGFLNLSHSSPIPALHFLLGELPRETRLHLDILSLFYNIWNNPETTICKIVQYLLKMAAGSSLTWAAYLRTIYLM